jgi:DNA-binding CsgD family transcriptional regulator
MPGAARCEIVRSMAGDGWSGLFASAFSQPRNPMLLVDADRRIVDVNGAFVDLIGRAKGGLVGEALFTSWPAARCSRRWGARFRREIATAPAGGSPLSQREREVVQHVALGDTGPEIASELGISHETVRTHVRNAMTKLGARSRAHLVAKTLTESLAEP